MKRRHLISISVLLAIAAAVGTLAAFRTAGIGTSSHAATPSRAAIAERTRRLDRAEASLHRALARKPPALPASTTPRPAQKVVYVRPAPVVHVLHRPGGDEGENREHDGGESDD
jgi:hypothetical protein